MVGLVLDLVEIVLDTLEMFGTVRHSAPPRRRRPDRGQLLALR